MEMCPTLAPWRSGDINRVSVQTEIPAGISPVCTILLPPRKQAGYITLVVVVVVVKFLQGLCPHKSYGLSERDFSPLSCPLCTRSN
jgi:hypothetical protein